MNIEDLSDEDLRIFLNVIPLDMIRQKYMQNRKLSQKLKGFRLNKVEKPIILKNAFNLVKREKNKTLISFLYDLYRKLIKDLNEDIVKLKEEGYDQSMAYSIAVSKSFDEEFRQFYYKYENIDKKTQKKVTEDSKLLTLIRLENRLSIKSDANRKIEDEVDFIKKDIYITKSKLLEEGKSLQNCILNVEKLSKKVCDLGNIVAIEKNNYNIECVKFIDKLKKLDNNLDNLSNLVKTNEINKSTDFLSIDGINELSKEIGNVKDQVDIISHSLLAKCFSIDYIKCSEKPDIDSIEHLDEDIDDVIQNLVEGSSYDVLREYLKEILFSNKPILTSSKNVNIISEILSSLITGGNYFEININADYNFATFKKQLDELNVTNENQVYVIKGLINVFDYHSFVDYVKKQPFIKKYIFEIKYDSEIKFVPFEIIDDFNLFFGNFRCGKIDYKYKNKLIETKPSVNRKFENILNQLDINFSNKEIFNPNYYGLLSYSIIPFKSLHDNIELKDLLNLIEDRCIRAKCEAIIND